MAAVLLTPIVVLAADPTQGRQTEREVAMATAGQAILHRRSPISVPRIAAAIAFAGGIGLGLVAGRSLSGALPASTRPAMVDAAPQQAADVAGQLTSYRTTQVSLHAALARGDMASAAHFRAQLDATRTAAIVSALAHERVDLELGLASATARHDPRMAAEFRGRLTAQDR